MAGDTPQQRARHGTTGCHPRGDTPGTPLLRGVEQSPAPGGHRRGGRESGVVLVPSGDVPQPRTGRGRAGAAPRDPVHKVAAAGAGPGRGGSLCCEMEELELRGGRGERRGLGQTDGHGAGQRHSTSICHPRAVPAAEGRRGQRGAPRAGGPCTGAGRQSPAQPPHGGDPGGAPGLGGSQDLDPSGPPGEQEPQHTKPANVFTDVLLEMLNTGGPAPAEPGVGGLGWAQACSSASFSALATASSMGPTM